MLCKVKEDITQGTYSYTTSDTVEAPADTSHRYPNGIATKYMEITAPYNSNYTVNVTATNTTRGTNTIGCMVVTLVNDIEVSNTEYRQDTTNISYEYLAKNIKAWDKITVNIYSWFNNDNYYNKIKATSGSITAPITLIKSGINIYPTNVKTIWVQTTGTIYGVYADKKYYGGIMLEKDTSATTWEITPGNFVGYITVNFNGEIVKIPYYNK